VKKYITRAGFDRLREQFRRLLYEERPRVTHEVMVAAAHGDRSENYEYKLGKRKLREIDAKIHRLQKQLESYEVVDPATRPRTDRVFFGATVTVHDEFGETTLQLVGPTETDPAAGRISAGSPVGKALLGHRAGDKVRLSTPGGAREIEIITVTGRA